MAENGLPDGTTFLGAPPCIAEAAAIRDAGARLAFFGAPIDTQVVPDRPGQTLGPAALRWASQQYSGKPTIEYGKPLSESWPMVDCGDAVFHGGGIASFHDRIREHATEILRGGAIPIMCGGDHSIPIPGVQALADVVGGSIGHLHVDAHLDMAHDVHGQRNTMASPVARILENPQIDIKNVAVIGVRGAGHPQESIDHARDAGLRAFPMTEILERGIAAVVRDALELVWDGTETIYVSFDFDSADPSVAPGTTSPEPFGLTSHDVWYLAQAIGERGVGMMDLAELSPNYDPAGTTARLGCNWIIYLLSAFNRAVERGTASFPEYANSKVA